MSAGQTPRQILAKLKRVEEMKLATDTKGPLKILTTVHTSKVRDELNMTPFYFAFISEIREEKERMPADGVTYGTINVSPQDVLYATVIWFHHDAFVAFCLEQVSPSYQEMASFSLTCRRQER